MRAVTSVEKTELSSLEAMRCCCGMTSYISQLPRQWKTFVRILSSLSDASNTTVCVIQYTRTSTVISGVLVEAAVSGGSYPQLPNCSLLENFLLAGHFFSSKVQHVGLKIFQTFEHQHLHLSVGKCQVPAPPTF